MTSVIAGSNGTKKKPIAIYHEHPDWFRPLFTELDKRGTKLHLPVSGELFLANDGLILAT